MVVVVMGRGVVVRCVTVYCVLEAGALLTLLILLIVLGFLPSPR